VSTVSPLPTQFSASNPALWLAGSLTLALIATNLAWLVARRSGLPAWSGLRALTWLLRSLFFLLLPMGAWRSGALSPYFMGLSELNWIDGLISGGPLAVLVMGLSVFGWLVYRRALSSMPRLTSDGSAGEMTVWRAPVDAGLQQWHWAFYRAAAIGWLAEIARLGQGMAAGTATPPLLVHLLAQPIYWGSWLGLSLVALEWLLNPFARAGLRGAGHAERQLRAAALALATTALFVSTRNFWLCLVCHVVVETAIAGWFPATTG
jgi:hypothetical protein